MSDFDSRHRATSRVPVKAAPISPKCLSSAGRSFSSAGNHALAPLRIAHLVGYSTWGGLEARVLETALWQVEAGHEVLLVAPPGSALLARAGAGGLRIAAIDFSGRNPLSTILRLRRTLRQHRIELVDTHGNRDSSYALLLRDLCAVVRTRHTLKRKPVRSLWRRLRWRVFYNHVITTSLAQKEELTGSGVLAPAAVTVIGEWARDCFFTPCSTPALALKNKLGLRPGTALLGTVAMLRSDNAFDDLIRAVALLHQNGQMVTCLIIGGLAEGQWEASPYVHSLKALAVELGVADAVHFLGPQRDLPELLSAMDVVAVVSRHSAQTRAVPEAFARGRPVVGFRVGAVPELVRDGETGWLLPLGDVVGYATAIGRLLDDAVARHCMGAAARAYAEAHLRQSAKMEKTLLVYRHVLEHSGAEATRSVLEGQVTGRRRSVWWNDSQRDGGAQPGRAVPSLSSPPDGPSCEI